MRGMAILMRLLGYEKPPVAGRPITFTESEERKFSETTERMRRAREKLEEIRRLRAAQDTADQT
jgi:hypothetical protein